MLAAARWLTRRWCLARLGSWNYQVRQRACRGLGAVGGPEAVEALRARLSDKDPEVRAEACLALSRVGSRAVVPDLLGVVGDRVQEVREAACIALGRLGEQSVAPTLVALLSWESSYVRRCAIAALGELRHRPALPALTALLDRYEPRVNAEVCLALGQIGGEGVIEPLTRSLEAHDALLRRAACEGLGSLGSAGAIGPLRRALSDASPSVRRAAADALTRTTNALAPRLAAMLCGLHFTRFERRVVTGGFGRVIAPYVACRECDTAARPVMGVTRVVAVLDDRMLQTVEYDGLAARVNWLRAARLFDFDEVVIRRADEYEIERFCIQVGNDMDAFRRPRYARMPVYVHHEAGLSQGRTNMLRSLFGEVRVQTAAPPPTGDQARSGDNDG